MDNSFLVYLQKIELLVFFSGYPLLYLLVVAIAGNQKGKDTVQNKLVSLLPYTYAFAGTLYLGLLCKNLYPDYSITHLSERTLHPYLTILGLSAMLFWIPALQRKRIFCFLHSLIFFFFLAKDFFIQRAGEMVDKTVLQNNMKIYTISFFMHLFLLLLFFVPVFLHKRFFYRHSS